MEDKIKRMKELVTEMEEYEHGFCLEDKEIYESDKEELFELIKSF